MMKIAIWGYGKYGRRMFESLTRLCPEEYEVACVYDTAYRKLNTAEGEHALRIRNPAEMPEDYKKGVFEKILLCIFNVWQKPKQFLNKYSIPELHLGSPDNFYPMLLFEQVVKPFQMQQEGYDFCVLKNVNGAMANYESDELLYLYDNKGRVLKEHWSHWGVAHIAFVHDYPFNFRNHNADKKFFKGEYCVLTKKFAGNYWHFTYQCLDVVWLLEKAGYRGKYIIPNKRFCSELMQLLDIAPERIITLSTFEHNKEYIFENVFYIASNKNHAIHSVPVLLEIAEYIRKKLPVDQSLPKKLYVKRIGTRKLLGADKLLSEYGFAVMIPENYSVLEQMVLFYNADIVFCVHGANSTNCLYMRKGTVFIEAFSSKWMNRCNLYTTVTNGVHYLPVSTLETIRDNNYDAVIRDFMFPEILLRSSIQNAFLIYKAQHGSVC
jgi:hypothetical protein